MLISIIIYTQKSDRLLLFSRAFCMNNYPSRHTFVCMCRLVVFFYDCICYFLYNNLTYLFFSSMIGICLVPARIYVCVFFVVFYFVIEH